MGIKLRRGHFPSADLASSTLADLISHESFFDLVAEIDGRIVGSNFLDERNPISGVGPITVDPALQNDGVGRALMQAIMRRSQKRGFEGMRLVQAGYHYRSLALYLKLGFEVREPLASRLDAFRRGGEALTGRRYFWQDVRGSAHERYLVTARNGRTGLKMCRATSRSRGCDGL